MSLWDEFQKDPFQQYLLGGGNSTEKWIVKDNEFRSLVSRFVGHAYDWLLNHGFQSATSSHLLKFTDRATEKYIRLGPYPVTSPYEMKMIILNLQKKLFKEIQNESRTEQNQAIPTT